MNPIKWIPRQTPLTAMAVVTKQPVAAQLVSKLLLRIDKELSELKGCYAGDYVVIIGDESMLPWINGAVYFGKDPDAPSLLMPTHSKPTVHTGLVEKAFSKLTAKGRIIIMPDDAVVIPILKALPLDTNALKAFLKETK